MDSDDYIEVDLKEIDRELPITPTMKPRNTQEMIEMIRLANKRQFNIDCNDYISFDELEEKDGD